MTKKSEERTFRVAPLLGAGVLSASLLKSSFDRVTQARDSVVKNAKNAMPDQLPAAMLSQLQLDHLAQAIADRATDLSSQMQGVAGRFTGKKPQPQTNYRAWWIAGIGLGFAAAGATAYVITRRRMHQQAAQELVALPTPMTNNGHHSPQQRLRGVVSNIMRRDAGDQPEAATSTTAGTANTATLTATEFEVADPAQAQFIGNIRTMIYHPSDSDHLPSEDNRIYFRSEDDAQAAGYHKAENE